MERDSSTYGKELLKLEKDKEIKEQSINNDKLRIILLKKKLLIRYNSRENIQSNKLDEIGNSNMNNNINNNNKNKSQNIIALQKSKIYTTKRNLNKLYIHQ